MLFIRLLLCLFNCIVAKQTPPKSHQHICLVRKHFFGICSHCGGTKELNICWRVSGRTLHSYSKDMQPPARCKTEKVLSCAVLLSGWSIPIGAGQQEHRVGPKSSILPFSIILMTCQNPRYQAELSLAFIAVSF